eukprot:TRINITY_DN27728_c0_g1_i1.p1 TRINITY_DN27728_c0_g1~~TRINITY_DN27728_c0_g1_i1.p1  ORF type:complete len:481 (+),score=88.39 TRINITY_DN27728_c0_g1_i1:40-1482(+)
MYGLNGVSPLRDRSLSGAHDRLVSFASMRSMSSFGGLLLDTTEESQAAGWQVGISLLVTLVGTGVLAMPMATFEAGYAGFVGIVGFIVVITMVGCYLTFRTLDVLKSHEADVAHIGYTVMGAKGFHLALFVCLFDTWGTVVGNIRAVADTVYSFVGRDRVSLSTVVYIVAILVWPLTLQKSIGDLRIVSLYAAAAMLYFCYSITADALQHEEVLDTLVHAPGVNDMASIVSSCSVIFFAFDCQVNLFPLYREMKGMPGVKTKSLMPIAGCAVGSAAVLYICLGLSGYITYMNDTSGNILDNLHGRWFLKVVFASAVFFTLPVLVHECANLLFLYLLPPSASPLLPNLLMIGSAAVFASGSPVYSTFRYLGATAGIMFTCILPPLFFLCAAWMERDEGEDEEAPYHANLSEIPNVESMPLLDAFGHHGHPSFRVEDLGFPSPISKPCPPTRVEILLSVAVLSCGLIAMPSIIYVLTLASRK